jgi:hypothetical protein
MMPAQDLDIWIDRVAQGIDPVAPAATSFGLRTEEERRDILRRVGLLALQAGARPADAAAAIIASPVKPRRTAAVLPGKDQLAARLSQIAKLAASELLDGFLLVVSLLAMADARRRATCRASGCSHWWHGDLRDAWLLAHARDAGLA